MKLGVTIGKFYPLHLGHDHLIARAKAEVDRLVVLVGAKPSDELPGSLRASWIRALHPEVEVIEVVDDLPEAPEPWARRTLEVLAGRRPDVAFTSESYGEPWAAHMGARHVAVDSARARFPISGTALRADLGAHWDMLSPPAKAHFAKRICVLGVESSGTTTLARGLAEHYGTAWVPEYGRHYWEGRCLTGTDWRTSEFVTIAKGQAAWEDALAARANRLLVCDTDPLATCVWHRRYLDVWSAAVEAIADARAYELYILTAPDFGFVQDGTRDGEHIRGAMHEWFVETLERKRKRWILVAGTREARLAKALAAIEPLVVFPPIADP